MDITHKSTYGREKAPYYLRYNVFARFHSNLAIFKNTSIRSSRNMYTNSDLTSHMRFDKRYGISSSCYCECHNK
jgi:hypothetical protein